MERAYSSGAGVLPGQEESRSGDSGPVAPGPAPASLEDVTERSELGALLTRMATLSQADLRRVQASEPTSTAEGVTCTRNRHM